MPEHVGVVLASPYRKSINASLYGRVAQGSKVLGEFSLQLRRDTDRITTAGGRACAGDACHACGRLRDDDRGRGAVADHRGEARAGRGRCARTVARSERRASEPNAAASSPNGELPHRSSRGPRTQFGRLTVLPRPGQPFPRSLAQERGLFARPTPEGCVGGTGQASGGRRNRIGCAPRRPFAWSARIAFLVPERTLRPIAGFGR